MQFLPVKQASPFSLTSRNTPTIIRTTTSSLSFNDRLKMFLVRLGIGRNKYRITPGLYRLGNPTTDSAVLVTANYGLTFNVLRSQLSSQNLWILVIETFGVNVWCAAGKGTFCTDEIVNRILSVRLSLYAPRATLILPQLAASGVNIFSLIKRSGFRSLYGPVRARDIPSFLNSGLIKNDAMRTVTFSLFERLSVAWLEFAISWPLFLISIPFSLLLSFISTASPFTLFPAFVTLLFGSVLMGTLGFPLLLPYLPSRIFALKGAFLSLLWCAGVALVFNLYLDYSVFSTFLSASFICVSVVSYLAMNFTGSTTFTCQRGAESEVRAGIIPMIVSAVVGCAGLIFLLLRVLFTL